MNTPTNVIKEICRFSFFFSKINTVFITPSSQIKYEFGHNRIPDLSISNFSNMYNQLNLHELNADYDIYFHSTNSKMNYISTKVYNCNRKYIGSIVIGPYLLEEPTDFIIYDIISENKLPISMKQTIHQYYMALPLVSSYKAKIIAKFLFYQINGITNICIKEPRTGNITHKMQTNSATSTQTISNKRLSIDLITKRYSLQNELMNAVAKGDLETAEKLFTEFFPIFNKLPNRIPNNPLRSQKNMLFVFNTLLRIAGERGGLPPEYLHHISENFAIKIESSTTIRQLSDLQLRMLRDYCEAVNNISLKDYCYIVRNAIKFIRNHLDQDLSLETIAQFIHVDSYKLSRLFKKETGQSLTDFINNQRINESLHLLDDRNLSITTIAQMIGFNDSNYFTKVFKKFKGVTPTQFRNGIT